MFKFLVLCAFTIVTQNQSFTFSLSGSTSIINESDSCVCNYSATACDEYCCCDTVCPSDNITLWDVNRKCINNLYSSPFTIPACNRDYQKTSTDLYLGLRIAYNIFKNLGCVTTSSTASTLQNIAINENDYTSKIQNYVDQYSTQATVTQLSQNNLITSTIISDESYLHLYRARSSSDSGCQSVQAVLYEPYPIQICQRQLTKDEITALSSTEFNYTVYQNGQLLGLPLKISKSYTITFNNNASKYQYTVQSIPSPPSGTTNFLVGAIYQFNMPEVLVDDTTVSNKPTSISATLFFLDNIGSSTNYVPSISGITYLTEKGEAYEVTNKGGYARGSLVRFKKSLDSTNDEMLQPLFVGVESYDGSCISANDLSHGLEIRFMEEQKISCFKSLSVSFTSSNIYTAIANNLKYVARYADSGSNNLATDEWMLVTPCSTTTDPIYQFSLKIGYIVFGEKGKERYRINSADLTCSQISIDIVTYEFRFYIQFVEIPNTWSHFVGPSPQLIGGLPDDILAPFINYG